MTDLTAALARLAAAVHAAQHASPDDFVLMPPQEQAVPDTSPATELRDAAERLRERLTGTTPGPWTATPRHRKGTNILAQYDITKPPRPGTTSPQIRAVHPQQVDEVYAATMHPAVGAALADWLDQAARDATEIGASPQAIAVARQILRTQATR